MYSNTVVDKQKGNFWQYVSRSDSERITIDRDRAMEYIRKNCLNGKVFRLVVMGTTIAFNQVRKTDKEILNLFADFLLQDPFPLPKDPSWSRVKMRMEIRREGKESRGTNPSTFYEMALLINHDGLIVDVDYQPLERQLAKQHCLQ